MDECEFEALRDMLDEPEAEDDNPAQSATTSDSEKPSTKHEEFESSDDDIDDDELDLLAMAVEEDMKAMANGKVTQVKSTETTTSKHSSDSLVEKETSKPGQVEMKSEVQSQSTNFKQDPGPAADASKKSSEQLQMSELQAMQEKIKQLEAELKKHTSPPPVAPSTPQQKTANVDTTSTNNREPKYKLMESDIFGSENSSSLKQPGIAKSQKSPASATSSDKIRNKSGSQAKTNQVAQFYKNKKPMDRPITNDSDSDWEGMDGEKPVGLSTGGREVKKIMKSDSRERVAHSPNFNTQDLEGIRKKASYNDTWRKKSSESTPGSSSSYGGSGSNVYGSSSQREPEKDVFHEQFSGIRIVNPLVSSGSLTSLMEGRKMIRMSRLQSKLNTRDLESDWVTIGVLTSKTDPKKSQKGNQYSIWRLSDLEDCQKVISFFLFKNVFTQHWKMLTGSVIGLLNPSIMQKEEKGNSNEVSITIDNPKKVLLMGKSRDMGKCKSVTKAGNTCTNFINTTQGEFCTYHVQSAYTKHSNKRAELQVGYNGVVPKKFEQKFFGKGGTVMYGGQSFSTTGHTNTKPKKNISVGTLQQHYNSKVKGTHTKVTTLELHDILPEDKEVLKKVALDKNEKFHEALTVPTVGSMNLVKHLLKQEKTTEKEKDSTLFQSVSAKDLLLQHATTMKQKREAHQKQKSGKLTAADSPKPGGPPSLGRGLAPGADVFFDLDSPRPSLKPARSVVDKKKAAARVAAKGGIKKEDPNAIKKLKSPEQKEKIKKRVAEVETDNQENKGDNSAEPPRKKSRFLGNLDLEDSEVQRLLNARSKHDGCLTEREQEKQDEYFGVLEKKEEMEDKMRSITEVKCTAYTCKQCKYTAFSAKPTCREQNHTVKSHSATKRFFQCKDCKCRSVSIQKLPTHACKKCSGQNFVRCSMLKEKSGPKLPTEELQLRGEEIKFLNSMNG